MRVFSLVCRGWSESGLQTKIFCKKGLDQTVVVVVVAYNNGNDE